MVTALIIVSILFAMLSLVLFMNLRNERDVAARLNDDMRQRDEKIYQLEDRVVAAERQHTADAIEIASLNSQLTAAAQREEERRRAQQERAREQEQREKQLSAHFKSLAAEIFNDHTRQFKESNKESIDQLLKPFRDNITTFKERVEQIYTFENEQRGALKNELERLMELNNKITAETHNLTSALKGNSKVQGDWGEMILETILESSNLTKGTHYTTQHNFKGEEGNNLRPDVVLNLPEGKRIIIDSKTSLTAFVNYTAAEDHAQQKSHIAAHILSVRKHIKELSNKEYQKMAGSPDFVIMFIPSEPAFLAALQSDTTLWSDAYESRVIISSPTNLFALLKLVDDLWKRDAQDRNTQRIVAQGTKLYDQLVLFAESLEDLGAAIGKAQSKYDQAYKRFADGNNNLIRVGEGLRKLGLPTKRRFSEKIQSDSEIAAIEEEA
ncbi:MAG: DNA recombination protein RmuC [Rikenellaceae bacterium]